MLKLLLGIVSIKLNSDMNFGERCLRTSQLPATFQDYKPPQNLNGPEIILLFGTYL